MSFRIMAVWVAALLSWIFSVQGQEPQAKAIRVADTVLTIDGKLDEPVWKDAPRTEITPDNPKQVYGEAEINGPKDCRVEFCLLWDNAGLYVGTWFYDDIHSARFSQAWHTAAERHKDDGLEWWITLDLEDVRSDPKAPCYGTMGKHLGKGFNVQADEVGGYLAAGEESTKVRVLTPNELAEKGFVEKHTSLDGVNFQSEAQFLWKGEIMGKDQTPRVGELVWFNLTVNDNDDNSDFSSTMIWIGATVHQSPECFGEVILGGKVGKPRGTTSAGVPAGSCLLPNTRL